METEKNRVPVFLASCLLNLAVNKPLEVSNDKISCSHFCASGIFIKEFCSFMFSWHQKKAQIFNAISSLYVCIANMNISSFWGNNTYKYTIANLSVPNTSLLSHVHVLLAEDPRGKCFAIKVYVVLAQI